MQKKIAVLGAGAIGASIGADLTHAGYDVTIIDQWPAHVEAMKADGLRVMMADEDVYTHVRACHICDVSTLNEAFDIVLLGAKSYDTRWMVELIKPRLKTDGFVVGMQNGMNDDDIASIVGVTRVIGCVVELSAEIFTPGVVQRNTARSGTWFAFGELHGRMTARLRELETIMRHATKVSLTTNIHGAKWTKLINSSMILAPFGMLGMQSWQATAIPEVVKLCIRLGRETLNVGTANGYTIEPIFGLTAEEFAVSTDEILEKLLKTILGHLGKNTKKARGVVLQDFVKGRLTETDYLSGLVVRKGREAGVPTPANAAVVEICRRIQRGQLTPDASNLALAERMALGS